MAALALATGCASDDPASAGSLAATVDAAHGEHAVTDHDGPAVGTATYEGGVVSPVTAAPPVTLDDINGRQVDFADLRGPAVLVTFGFANGPDVRPLTMSTLSEARRRAGAAGRDNRVIAVSVDPEGDTPAAVRSFLQHRRVGGLLRFAVGSRPELEAVWADRGVATQVPRDNPELIEHTALIDGVNAPGELVTAHPVASTPRPWRAICPGWPAPGSGSQGPGTRRGPATGEEVASPPRQTMSRDP